uniref:Uncharacterized protein n=1 Tax=Anopheles stephensi TaxID=30069 RepID=A0A182YFC9_ANOST
MQKEDFSFDVNKICRLCLQELQDGSFLDIFTMNLPVSPLAMLSRCVTIEIYEKDGLPSAMCNNCYYQLETAFEFRNRCESSDRKLRVYQNIPNDDGKNELLLSINEHTDNGSKEDDIYAAMSEIFGPEEETAPLITPHTLGKLLEDVPKEPPKECPSPRPPKKVKIKRQIKKKAQLDKLLEKHKEKLWLDSTKLKIFRQRQTVPKRSELSIEVDENRSLESAASSELSVATSLMDSQSYSYGGMPYAQTFVPQPSASPPPPAQSAQHFSHVSHQHHHLHHSHLAAGQQHHPYPHPHHHRHHQQQPPHHHHHHHHHSQPIIHQSMAVNQPAGNLYTAEYLPPYHSTALPTTQQTHYELGGYDMCYSMPASTVLNPSLMNPQPTYIFDQ